MNAREKLSMMVGAVVLALVAIVLVVWLIWQGMALVDADVARAWALLATAGLPVALWAGWYFGRIELRGRLAGIDQAVGKVMGAATAAAGLGVRTSRAMRQPAELPLMIQLPEPEIVTPRSLSGGDVVEL